MESNLKTLQEEAQDPETTADRKAILEAAVQRLQEASVFFAIHKIGAFSIEVGVGSFTWTPHIPTDS